MSYLISGMIGIDKSCHLHWVSSWFWSIGWYGFGNITIEISPLKAGGNQLENM
jgi:hypothetical protein